MVRRVRVGGTPAVAGIRVAEVIGKPLEFAAMFIQGEWFSGRVGDVKTKVKVRG